MMAVHVLFARVCVCRGYLKLGARTHTFSNPRALHRKLSSLLEASTHTTYWPTMTPRGILQIHRLAHPPEWGTTRIDLEVSSSDTTPCTW
jgi:hypothetical protein